MWDISLLLYLTDLIFSWIFNEYPTFVRQDSRRFISQETGNLYIAKVEPSDVGNYTCVVTNTVTKSRVQGPPTPLVLRSDGEPNDILCLWTILYIFLGALSISKVMHIKLRHMQGGRDIHLLCFGIYMAHHIKILALLKMPCLPLSSVFPLWFLSTFL